MKEIEIYVEWRSSHMIEVPDDYDEDQAKIAGAFELAWLDQTDSSTAEVINWGFA